MKIISIVLTIFSITLIPLISFSQSLYIEDGQQARWGTVFYSQNNLYNIEARGVHFGFAQNEKHDFGFGLFNIKYADGDKSGGFVSLGKFYTTKNSESLRISGGFTLLLNYFDPFITFNIVLDQSVRLTLTENLFVQPVFDVGISLSHYKGDLQQFNYDGDYSTGGKIMFGIRTDNIPLILIGPTFAFDSGEIIYGFNLGINHAYEL